jgi:glycosyltransferase involved in cell wall biosynthesis
MKLVVISFAPFVKKEGHFCAYSPYIKEINIWAKHSDEIAFVCPILKNDSDLLLSQINFPITKIFVARAFYVKSFWSSVKAFQYSFWNFYQLFRAMIWADHIHLRCPGNLGLMACVVQIFFPSKVKTAKYAGNWDPKSKQPMTYKLQKWLLSSTLLTKNMQVLVYGNWEGMTKNIKPFFTASYHEDDKILVGPRDFEKLIDFIFVGTLSAGKRPLYAIKMIQELAKKGLAVRLCLYGSGSEKSTLEDYITEHQLGAVVFLKGNYSHEEMKKVYQQAHFNILPSRSEGWPKVVAEGMFWGCLPIATRVSCVPTMLDAGKRGLLLAMDFQEDVELIYNLIQHPTVYEEMVIEGIAWSRKYTLDLFESEIKNLLLG